MSIDRLLQELAERDCPNELIDDLLRKSRQKLETSLRHLRRPQSAVAAVSSALGPLLIAIGPRGLLMVHYLRQPADAAHALAALRLKFDPVEDEPAAGPVRDEIARFLAGNPAALQHRVDLSMAGGGFERAVLTRLAALPHGAVTTYQALGCEVGAPRASRAVGNAMHVNPVPIYVPCHQVIRSDGSLGGYGGGVDLKVRLLRAEGFKVDDHGRLDGEIVYGHRATRVFCRPTCPAVRRADPRNFLTLANPEGAIRVGMRPCRACRPV